MEILALFISLILSLGLCEQSLAITLNGLEDGIKQRDWLTKDSTNARVSTEVSSAKCELQGSTREPVFSQDGDYVIGGVFSIHHYVHTVKHNYTSVPEPQKCLGRLVRVGGGA